LILLHSFSFLTSQGIILLFCHKLNIVDIFFHASIGRYDLSLEFAGIIIKKIKLSLGII